MWKKQTVTSKNVRVIDGSEGAPSEPDWKFTYQETADQQRAHSHWQEVCSALRDAGGLAVSNGHAIMRLVSFRMEFDRSANDVAEKGILLPGTQRKLPRTNPHFRYMRQIDESIRQLEAELGIAPVRRGRIGKVQRRVARARPADAYLGRAVNK